MIATRNRQGQRAKKWRLRVKDGFHMETVAKDTETLFEKGDVFLANRPLHEKWPEKFERVDDHVALTTNRPPILGIAEDPDEERYWEPDTDPVPEAGTEKPQVALKEFPRNDRGVYAHMTARELREYAEANEIDLGGVNNKEGMIDAILKAAASAGKASPSPTE